MTKKEIRLLFETLICLLNISAGDCLKNKIFKNEFKKVKIKYIKSTIKMIDEYLKSLEKKEE